MLENILETCKQVTASNNSKHVKINISEIDKLIKNININNQSHWLVNAPFDVLNLNIEDIVNYLLTLHAIGFSFWGNPKWTIDTEYGTLDGFYAAAYALFNEVKKNKNFLNPNNLQHLSRDELQRILGSSVEIPLFEERYLNLISIGKSINEKMNGNFYLYIKDITDDIELFNTIINNFDIFNDISPYKGKQIYFYKIAQILVFDILLARQLKEKIEVDYSHLVGAADYKIPQVLRTLGILEYDKELSKLVDNKIEILHDSSYEIEIRASSIVIINMIYEKLNRKVCPMVINNSIWLQGQNKTSNIKPYHLSRNKYY
jgi:hypothetical protein